MLTCMNVIRNDNDDKPSINVKVCNSINYVLETKYSACMKYTMSSSTSLSLLIRSVTYSCIYFSNLYGIARHDDRN